MADPHIQSPMDIFDKLTVCVYRLGFLAAAIGVALLPYRSEIGYSTLLTAATMCASSLHLYLKSFRLLLQAATWIALLCQMFGFPELALGGALLTLSGLCFKEYFCFRIPTLNFMPIFVVLLWLGAVTQTALLLQIMSAICALLLAILFIQKCRMPLHFDIGDKTKYQI
ncbi:putative integral membrane protein [Pasteurella langaaensis DSM 22999]|uniref:Putative integral membrane protein n=1 Tax=Alitibacter langaaensis DSM 22999 TaxID=1122935 RepID=A0A2U0T6Q3_9PAST|nr:DUF2301 domain-containing membrane protein [Pasteurella langaaensis]PVX39214.1 putative integral membrane protein [Pasteurella langaaensis DSM 22999]